MSIVETLRPGGSPFTAAGAATSLVDAVRHWAVRTPGRPACTYVDYSADPDGRAVTLSYAELDARARALAVAIGDLGGDVTAPVAVLCPQSLEYVVAFLGALYAGRVAVPLHEPGQGHHADRVACALADSGASVLLTTARAAGGAEQATAAQGTAAHGTVLVDRVDPRLAAAWRERGPVDREQVAYLQYSSGSTREPAGVMVSHRHLAEGCAQIAHATGSTPGDGRVVGGWLPLYHDMGLVYTLAFPLVQGGHAVLQSPYSFVKRPVQWLHNLTRHRVAVTSVAPFALDLILDRATGEGQLSGVDLSTLDVLMIGAEPIRPDAVRRFTERLAPYGLRPEACSPAYGLAEATLVVTHDSVRRPARSRWFDRAALARGEARIVPVGAPGAVELMDCGEPLLQDVAVVDAVRGEVLPEGRTGEVWVHGPNVTGGYWRSQDRDRETFHQVTRDSAGRAGGWLRTGDIGVLVEGALHIAGRRKEVIIVNGHNHYPVDIERTVESAAPELRPGHVAALAVTEPAEGTETVVVVAEAVRPHEVTAGVRERVAMAVRAGHGIEIADFVVVRRGALPRTSSGKLKRTEYRSRYLDAAYSDA